MQDGNNFQEFPAKKFHNLPKLIAKFPLGIKIARMPEKYLFYFGLTGIVGLAIMIAGLKLSDRPKKIFETLGAVVFHVGVFGILYFKLSITLFVSLVSLVLSLFVLIDPLKISLHVNKKIYQRAGYSLLMLSLTFFTMYFTNFPVWLWLIPLVVYALPRLIPPFKKQEALLTVMASVCVFVYLALITYAVYTRFYPDNANIEMVSWFTEDAENGLMSTIDSDQKKLMEKLEATTPHAAFDPGLTQSPLSPDSHTVTPTAPSLHADNTADITDPDANREEFRLLSQDGPFTKSLREADIRFLKLKDEYKRLKQKNLELEKENAELKARLK